MWSNESGYLSLIYLINEDNGYTNSTVEQTMTPDMFDDINKCYAASISIEENCQLFFSTEVVDYRYTDEDLRCHAEIYRMKDGKREQNPFIVTAGVNYDKSLERPDHFYDVYSGEYLMLFKPSEKMQNDQDFCCRISTKCPHKVVELALFSSFEITNEVLDRDNDLMLCPFASFGSLNMNEKVRIVFRSNGYFECFSDWSSVFDDPNPGHGKVMIITTIRNNEQLFHCFNEKQKFVCKPGQDGTPQDLNKYKTDLWNEIIFANFGGLDVTDILN